MSNTNSSDEDRMKSGKIVRRADLDNLRRAESILQNAETTRQQSEQAAEVMREAVLKEARNKALKESTRAAAKMIAEAEATAAKKLLELEPEMARLVAETVREIIGQFDTDEAIYMASLTALKKLRDHQSGRVYCNSHTASPIRRAIADLPEGNVEIEGLVIDDNLENDRAIISSNRGHAEIGLTALTDAALKAWETEAAPERDQDE